MIRRSALFGTPSLRPAQTVAAGFGAAIAAGPIADAGYVVRQGDALLLAGTETGLATFGR